MEELKLEARSKWPIPNELCPEKPDVALRAGRAVWEALFPRLTFRSISNTYNCVGMVVASRRVWVLPEYLERIFREDGFRRLQGLSEVEPGDIVVYQTDGDDEPTHVALVVRKQPVVPGEREDPLVVLSKWGGFGEYEHESQHVPNVYGQPTQFWTHRRNP